MKSCKEIERFTNLKIEFRERLLKLIKKNSEKFKNTPQAPEARLQVFKQITCFQTPNKPTDELSTTRNLEESTKISRIALLLTHFTPLVSFYTP